MSRHISSKGFDSLLDLCYCQTHLPIESAFFSEFIYVEDLECNPRI
jgi:hypothetical protein